ncbi:MAG TPA: cation-translocating P-type ATPase [Rhabdochlamydiaceae bacterium]|jgi:heavy metal translocating P-type ATPase|nr:cation-translocating P-type ATPase [Rhabdochlamydiaceae bacterium]
MTTPYSFDEFFATNKEETVSPFLTPDSRKWGKYLSVRSALFAGFLLASAFVLSFYSTPVSLALLTTVYFLAGTPALINAIHDLLNLEINIDVLMTLAAFLSVIIGSEMEGALLLVLFEFSAAMEGMVAQKTRSSVLSLHKLSPRVAYVINERGLIYEKALADIAVGAHILVKAGEIIPLDGQVIEGRSYVNLVHLTGESQPMPKTIGDEVPAGAGNLDGTLTISVTRTSGDSTVSRIIQLITQAQDSKPKIEQFLDRFGKYYASTIIVLSLGFALALPAFWGLPYFGTEGSVYRALAFLIAASPCALIIATPTAYLSALSSCARRGILPKGGIMLDAVSTCTTVALDKTGTLTTGQLSCTAIEQLSGPLLDPTLAIAIAASLERHAVHPIAEALTAFAQTKKIKLLPVENFRSIPGYGLEGTVASYPAMIGQREFIQEKSQVVLPSADQMVTYLFVKGSLFVFHFTDTLRPNAKKVIANLKQQNLRIVMLTGDHASSAKKVANELSIDEVFANLRPEDKLAKVTELSTQSSLIMVGDGINDAPALARATVGISMGKIGSATAVDASDIIFIHDDISLLRWLYQKAHQTRRILKENIALALGVILFATTPALLGWVPLWAAVILHEGGTVLVGLNSLRLLKK